MELVAVLFSVAIASLSAGATMMLIASVRKAVTDVIEQKEEFAHITEQAAKANNSLAEKIISMEKRLEVCEFRAQAATFAGNKVNR